MGRIGTLTRITLACHGCLWKESSGKLKLMRNATVAKDVVSTRSLRTMELDSQEEGQGEVKYRLENIS